MVLSSLDTDLGDGADDAAVGAPLADQIHDPVCDFLDEGQTSPLVVSRLKRWTGETPLRSVCDISV